MLIKEGLYLGTQSAPAFVLFFVPRLSGCGGTWGKALLRGRKDPSPDSALPIEGWRGRGGRPWPRVLPSAEPTWKGNLYPHRLYFLRKVGKYVSGSNRSIPAQSLPWIHPRASTTTLTSPFRVEDGSFWHHSAQSTPCAGQMQLPHPLETHPSMVALAWQKSHQCLSLPSFSQCLSAQQEHGTAPAWQSPLRNSSLDRAQHHSLCPPGRGRTVSPVLFPLCYTPTKTLRFDFWRFFLFSFFSVNY